MCVHASYSRGRGEGANTSNCVLRLTKRQDGGVRPAAVGHTMRPPNRTSRAQTLPTGGEGGGGERKAVHGRKALSERMWFGDFAALIKMKRWLKLNPQNKVTECVAVDALRL